MRRRLFNLAAAVSLMFFVASAGGWVVSYYHVGYVRLPWPSGHALTGGSSLYSTCGTLEWQQHPSHPEWSTEYDISFAGFVVYAGRDLPVGAGTAEYWRVWGVPYWSVVLLTAIIPLAWLHVWRRSGRCAGRCVVCGYDLRATPERCPECGTAVGERVAI